MKRRMMIVLGAAAALGSIGGLAPLTAAHAAEPQIINVCLTVVQHTEVIYINGTPIVVPVPGVSRTCHGV